MKFSIKDFFITGWDFIMTSWDIHDDIMNGRHQDRFEISLWIVKISMMTDRDFIMNSWDIHEDISRLS